MSYQIAGPMAYIESKDTLVSFTKNSKSSAAGGTVAPIREMQTALNVAYWGEDNRFPQNIEKELKYVGIARSALDWKLRMLWGNGIMPGRVVDYLKDGTEVFKPIKPGDSKHKEVWKFINSRKFSRFFLEFAQDWTYFANCFPEIVFSKDAKTITDLVHQESCDARYKQMNAKGKMENVYLSKLWGAAKDQFALFDPKKKIKNLIENPTSIDQIDSNLIKSLKCIDMYDPVTSATDIAQALRDSKGLSGFKSAILPVNWPSINKTYYQVAAWDGARLAGWYEIAGKTADVFKIMLEKAWKVRYHIEIPESFFEDKYGAEIWQKMDEKDQQEKKRELLKDMTAFLSGSENIHKTLITFFSVDKVTKKDYGQVKITALKDETNIDKDLLLGSAANYEILTSLNVHPTLFSASMGNTVRSGGSDQREAFLIYTSGLHLERKIILEPLDLVRDFNRDVGGISDWSEDLVFRVRDTVLTTLDKGKGTIKTVS
jgi:hypothetical protein